MLGCTWWEAATTTGSGMAAMALFLLLSLDSLSPIQLGSQLQLELGSQRGLARQLGTSSGTHAVGGRHVAGLRQSQYGVWSGYGHSMVAIVCMVSLVTTYCRSWPGSGRSGD